MERGEEVCCGGDGPDGAGVADWGRKAVVEGEKVFHVMYTMADREQRLLLWLLKSIIVAIHISKYVYAWLHHLLRASDLTRTFAISIGRAVPYHTSLFTHIRYPPPSLCLSLLNPRPNLHPMPILLIHQFLQRRIDHSLLLQHTHASKLLAHNFNSVHASTSTTDILNLQLCWF